MKQSSSALTSAVCIGVAVLAVFASLDSYAAAQATAAKSVDTWGVGQAQARFGPVLQRTPVEARLAYITDIPADNDYYAVAFLAAQYVLAPRQLMGQDADATLAVGNFTKAQDYSAAGAARGYEVAEDLGNGVVLFRKRRL